jgi:hypothetical protein
MSAALAGLTGTDPIMRSLRAPVLASPVLASPVLASTVLAAAALALAGCGSSAPPASSSPPTPSPVATHASTPASSPATVSTPPAASPSASAQAAGCLSRYLHGATGLSQGTAGSIYVTITFKNLDNVPCTLYGYPGVALAAGTPVTDIGQPSTENPTTPRELVTLQPGGFAYATLRVVDAGNFPPSVCTQVPSTWLAVIPPNQRVPLYVPWKSTACKGSAKLLSVTSVRPGTGG